MARSLQPAEGLSLAAAPMARRSQLEGRLLAILDPSLSRGSWNRATAGLAAAAAACVVLVLAAIGPPQAGAQSTMGSISGTVYDQTGGVVPNATVSIVNAETSLDRTVSTNERGFYSHSDLLPGRYNLQMTRPGFAMYRERNLVLAANASLRKNVVLKLGSITESVEVHAAVRAAQLKTVPSRIRVGGNVQATKLLSAQRPKYPERAKADGIAGAVLLRAIIGKDGSLGELTILAAPDPELANAALEAVRQWRYQPTLLNGQPVEVDTTIEVDFVLE